MMTASWNNRTAVMARSEKMVCLVRAAMMVHLVKTVTIKGWVRIGTVVRMSWARA